MKLKEFYHNRLADLQNSLKTKKRKERAYSILRLLSFLVFTTLTILAFQFTVWLGLVALYAGLYLFYRIIRIHQELRKELNHHITQIALCQSEINALDLDLTGFNGGSRFADPHHNYASDLDIFGPFSLYATMNRCTSYPGQSRLAHLLKNGLDQNRLKMYQSAVANMEARLDWRQQFFAIGKEDFQKDDTFESLSKWLISPPLLHTPFWIQYGVPLLSWGLFGWLLTMLPWYQALIGFLPCAIVAIRDRKKIDQVHNGIYRNENYLFVFGNMARFIEESKFDEDYLQSRQSLFLKNQQAASTIIRRAKYVLSQLNIRYNVFGIVMNLVTLWDHYWANQLEAWKSEYGASFLSWIDVLAEFEVLNSLATFAFNHPHFIYPEFDENTVIDAVDLVHPLIHPDKVVSNDIQLRPGGHILIVTGSNMGGKSTYLRTVGVNVILARSGTRVGAHKFLMSDIHVITSMRTQDALEESVSSFYAELRRLRLVLDSVKENPNTVFLLDEILKGTNSNDRHRGAKAIIVQLLGYRGAGLISTHDLDLGSWANIYSDHLENICFEVQVEGDELTFDYTLKPGISSSFNASQLMRKMGIEI